MESAVEKCFTGALIDFVVIVNKWFLTIRWGFAGGIVLLKEAIHFVYCARLFLLCYRFKGVQKERVDEIC